MKRRLVWLAFLAAAFRIAAVAQGELTITSPPTLPSADVCTPSATVTCSTYSFTFTATGGSPPLTWSAPSGIPPGLALDPASGVLSGIPTTANPQVLLVIQVGDTSQGFASQIPAFAINPQPSITTDALPQAFEGQQYRVALQASGGTAPFAWKLAQGPLPAGLTLSPDGVLSGTPTASGQFPITVQLTDSAGAPGPGATTVTAAFRLNVVPRLQITSPSTLPPADACVSSATVTCSVYSFAFTATGGTPPLSWSAPSGIPPGFAIDQSTGVFSGTSRGGTQTFTVLVFDTNQTFVFSQETLPVNGQPAITTTFLPNGIQQSAYSATVATAGGTAPFTWELAGGDLPAGITLSPSGTLSGTPTSSGNFTFTVLARDSAGVAGKGATTVTATLTLTVIPKLQITSTPNLQPGTVGLAYSFTFTGSGGTPTYTWSVSTASPASKLPPGLAVDAFTGVLSGTPTLPGVYPFTIDLSDLSGQTASQNISLTVGSPLMIPPVPLPDAKVGAAYSFSFMANASPSNGNLTWSVAPGSTAPPGLTVDAKGNLAGTPVSPGAFPFTVQVKDADARTASAAVTLNVQPGILITSGPALTAGTKGVAYMQQLTATGGIGNLTWQIASGTLPPGTTLAGTGLISGKPETAGSFAFTVRVTDSATPNHQTATAALSLVITASEITITTHPVLPSGSVGSAYSLTFSATGGVAPTSWSLISGALPAGLQIAPNGVLSGTPSKTVLATFIVQVADSVGTTASQQFTLSIGLPPAPPVSIGGLDNATSNSQPTVQLTLASQYPTDIAGTMTLSFASNVDADDGTIRFINPDPSDPTGRTFTFTVPAGSTIPTTLPQLQTGTTAGTITVTVVLASQGQTIAPSPNPVTIPILAAPPQLTSVSGTRNGAGFTISITGFCTSRQVTQATFQFSGPHLDTHSLTIETTGPFSGWYQNAASLQTGTAFTFVQPFTIQGDPNGISSVTVTLTGPQGVSQASQPIQIVAAP